MIASNDSALQHGPRPLPLFLTILREQLTDQPDEMARMLAALRKYQQAERSFLSPPGEILLQQGRSSLRAPRCIKIDKADYQPDIVFIPSPINAPHILDMQLMGEQSTDRNQSKDAPHANGAMEGMSLMRWLHGQGHRPALLDWGKVDRAHRDEDVGALVERYILPILAQLSRPVHLIGYCLGGMIALAAAHHLQLTSLTLIATPWDFDGYSDQRRDELARLWQRVSPASKAIGVVPIETIQEGFWRLSPEGLIGKYLAFGDYPADSLSAQRFIAIEDWANGGEPLPYALAEQIFTDLYGKNLSGQGLWQILGKTITPDGPDCSVLSISSQTDQIVPLSTAPIIADQISLAQGHVGMVVSSRARDNLWLLLQKHIETHNI